ncbi:hypothetical protein PVAND_012906 [Polypedilum vanderplanki]|uniref:Ubiquitin carboxyl-terminal hydrolase n=1 Tax=Polypedilum vanderplanki TaxID=319348 RepID=A0A9J6CMW9_POLVA|nr:hypothetical protein PVAND_012906 [Polypedilum vanderplanki]
MPVISTRRYSSYLSPSSTTSTTSSSTSSGIGSSSSYRSSNYTSSLSSTNLPSTSSRYLSNDSSYRSYRSSLLSTSTSSGTTSSSSAGDRSSALSSYRSRYSDYDDNKSSLSSSAYEKSRSDTLSARIGVSRKTSTSSRFNSTINDTLPPLPPNALASITSSSSNTATGSTSNNITKRSLSRSRDQDDSGIVKNGDSTNGSKLSLMNDLDFYEKYSPSRYYTKYDMARSRSLSETTSNTNREPSPSSTPKSEIRSVALRNALPTTTRTWDRDYTSSYSSRNTLGDSKLASDKKLDGESRSNGLSSSYAAGGYRANNISPSKSPARDSLYDRKTSSLVEGQCGLWNIGNTCFMNSVLQCLSHTQDLSKFARSSSASSAVIDKGSTSSAKDQKIWKEFCKLLSQMWQPGAKSVNPSDLKMALSSKYRMYSGSAQQDAQEFLRYLLDALHGALNKGGQKISLHIDDDMSDLEKSHVMWEWYTKRENSVIKDLFVGQLKSSLHCTHCEKTSVMYDPFWDLSVPVPSTPNCKLDKCLELFTVKDVLDGNEMPYCDYCKTTRKCIKWFTIQRFPKYLVIHLKRFSEMRWTKLTNIVEFPTGIGELDLTPYAADSIEKSDPPPIYSLYGISNHMGSTHGGHYVASCKHPVTKKWFEYNDNFVSETRESSLVSSSAYLLFYERV